MTRELLTALILSVLFGLLIGIQRERNESDRMGARTFTMITLFGTVCGFLSRGMGFWIVGVGLVITLGLTTLGWLRREAEHRRGLTTEVAAILMYCVGVLLVMEHREVALVVGGLVAVLLQSKVRLHTLAARLGEEDVRAIMTFILVACIVMPVLPDRNFGPYLVLNPREVWLFVVLIVGLNLTGYLAYRFYGERAGIWLGGIMGGIVSSTATTVSWSKIARDDRQLIPASEVVILVATAIAFFRVMLLIGAVSLKLAWSVAMPLGVLGVTCLIESLWMAWRYHLIGTGKGTPGSTQPPESMVKNPTQLRAALGFAAMYAVILLAIAWVKDHLSFSGPIMVVVAAVSGLTDMDAIAMSTARLVDTTDPSTALSIQDGRLMIVSAAIGALLFKIGIAATVGNWRQGWRLTKFYAIPIAAAILTAMVESG
ncbi:MAG: DUF4010 domain-containing protein [Planctomycetia bacterium]|nr:DUF4010 domain-containing protein [Planctomycetia bacterium]